MARGRTPWSMDTLFYTHGLLCASYPTTVLCIVAAISIGCSFPFFFTPSGELNWPKPWRSPWLNYRVPVPTPDPSTPPPPPSDPALHDPAAQWLVKNATQFSGRTPSWFLGLPVAVIQQLYVHLEVNCEEMDQLCQRSFYGASKSAAALLTSRLESVLSTCLPLTHPAALKLSHSLAAEDGGTESLGLLSPLIDSSRGSWDDVLPYQTVKELLYGGFWEHRHLPPTSSGTKSHSFALSFLLEPTQENFPAITSCVQSIKSAWPEPAGVDTQAKFMKHFYFEPAWYIMNFAPLLCVYFIVFLYISFSVGKINLVKSKFGLGFTACVTVFLSLVMSLGICSFFGLSISLSGTEVYPYVVVIIGLENTLIIVKAVMSTPEELEVKHRIATGLSKEGQVLMKNVLTPSLLLGIGVLAFNYTMKEFCIIALVGLLCDSFLQLVFFLTVLSIDLRRMELTDLRPAVLKAAHSGGDTPANMGKKKCPTSLTAPVRWRSRRVKFAYFLANARLISKAITVALLAYLLAWFSQTETFHQMVGYMVPIDPSSQPLTRDNHLMGNAGHMTPPDVADAADISIRSLVSPDTLVGNSTDVKSKASYWHDLSDLPDEKIQVFRTAKDGFDLQCENELCWRPMVTTHWPRLFHYYDYDMEGRFLTLLPPLAFEVRVGFSPPHDRSSPSLSVSSISYLLSHPNARRLLILVILGLCVSGYFRFLFQLGRRRHRQYQRAVSVQGSEVNKRVSCLRGHAQDIECMCVDAGMVVSASLDGDIKVWDTNPMRRRCITTISRSKVCGDYVEGLSTKFPRARPAAEGCEDSTETLSSNGVPAKPPKQRVTSRPPSASDGLGAGVAPWTNSQLQSQARLPEGRVPPPLFAPNPSSQQNLAKSISLQEICVHTPPLSPHPPQPLSPPPPTVPAFRRSHRRMPSLPVSLHSAVHPMNPSYHGFYHSQSHTNWNVHDVAPPLAVQGQHYSQENIGSQSQGWKTARRHSIHEQLPQTELPPSLPPYSCAQTAVSSHAPHTTPQPLVGHTHSPPSPPGTTQSGPPLDRQILPAGPTGHSVNGSLTHVPFHPPPPRPPSLSPADPRQRVSHSRNHSLGSIPPPTLSTSRSHGNTGSTSEVTRSSNHQETVSRSGSADSAANPSPEANGGYNFSKHFNLFSQFTSNLALEHCGPEHSEDVPEIAAPPVWCMDVWNNVIALGCGNGQIEAWDLTTGSLRFCQNMTQAGVTTITVTSQGIISGHMDGFLHLIGHNGFPQHSIQAHSRAISVMRTTTDKVLTGGYDSVVCVHRVIDFCLVNSVFVHTAPISALTLIEPQGISCASGCGKGLVCCWEVASGKCLHEFEEQGVAVLKLSTLGSYLVALFADECLRVWDSGRGSLLHTIKLGGICHDFAVLGSRYLAVSVEMDSDSLQSWCLLHRFKNSSMLVSESSVTIYDLETGQKHSEKPLDLRSRGMALIRHVQAVDSAYVACSVGREVQIVPCELKLKSE